MRLFSSYGPINPKRHYHAPRVQLLNDAYCRLIGENPSEGGHYITVWAPRQCGKTWVMREAVKRINEGGDYEVGIFSMEGAKEETEIEGILDEFVENMRKTFQKNFPSITTIRDLKKLFTKEYFEKPVIIVIDEFDAHHRIS